MSIIVPPFATNFDLTIPAGGAVSAFSQGSYSVLVSNNANSSVPPLFSKLADVAAGSLPFTSSTFTNGALVRIDASGGSEVSVDVGLSPAPKLARAITVQGAVVSAVNVSATLTAAQMIGGFITSTTAAAVTATLPTGTVMDTSGVCGIGEGFLWHVSNTGATNALTVVTAAGNTLNGSGTVALSTTAQFITFKTAANTYQTWRAA